MIQALSNKYRQPIAATLSLFFCLQMLVPLYGYSRSRFPYHFIPSPAFTSSGMTQKSHRQAAPRPTPHSIRNIGGPSSPEAGSFKAVGSNNLVNLFTGDFSYSIPLLDVDGYPVNLFYNGGITMDQEASWVGLGWNINPGSVSRNMRGVPDDFDGTDTLVQKQNVKPNKTWGGEVGVDAEVLGIKGPPKVNFNLGFSYNNYLGPELEIGAGVSVSIPIVKTIVHEKSAPNDSVQGLNLDLSLGGNAKLSSRSGLTLSPSLNAQLHSVTQKFDGGVGISTSYNSRTGIKDLSIHSQMSAYQDLEKEKDNVPSSKGTFATDLSNTTISFARPSYMPTLRMPMQNSYSSGQLEVGAGMFGLRGAGTLQGYYTQSKVASTIIYKPLVGYMYLENANGRKDAIMDFNRLNDGEVTPHTPVISAPQYDYDIFSIQGEGTGGSIRAYRSDLGFMRDHETQSKDNNLSLGFDIAPSGHFGGNVNVISAPTRSGNWNDGSNTLNQTLTFTPKNNSSFENVYFRNPGEATVTNDNMIAKIGQDNLVRFRLSGSAVSPRLESQLEQFSKKTGVVLGTLPLATANATSQRDKRTQVITMLTADDASRIGLDNSLRNYQSALDGSNNLQSTPIPRVGNYRKGHHISEITVLESTGMRYVYGLPVYNTVQKDFTFSVSGSPLTADNNLAPYTSTEPTLGSTHITSNTGIDGYVSIQQTPAYASSFLITGLLSPDYVDVTGNGITEDDLGSAVKFDYSLSPSLHKWRTPRNNPTTTGPIAHFNTGLKTEKRDNKATISYGEREAWYLHSIESKSMIAVFSTSARNDAKGVVSDLDGTANSGENANQKLDSISLYTKADIKAHGFAGSLPLKTIHFDYSYGLCTNTPDNPNSGGGKLTLIDIYFTFNGQSRASKNMYVFDYGALGFDRDNATYKYNASDRWGTYKPVKDSASNPVNPNGLNNIDYPYTVSNKAADDQFAGEWALKKILLPSGGQMEMQYEADDYAYVQNRRACNLFNLYGMGNSTDFSQGNMLYTIYSNQDQNYAYVQLPSPLVNTDPVKIKKEILSKYLDGINQIAFKLNINMPKGMESLTAYTNYDDYGLCTNSTDRTVIYIKLRPVDGKGPLANASVHFLIDNLPGQAFPGYDMSEPSGITAFLDLVGAAFGSLAGAFKNAETQIRSAGLGSTISLANSFIRLDNPSFVKYGGGYRVKRILVKDNWKAMSQQYDSQYGQDYDYTTTQMVNGVSTTISSGVASYEPGVGSEENPFREILQFENKLPLASAQYGAIEMPALEALYPAPVVGYSKVTVRSIHRNGTHADSAVRSAIGKQVTEFYTAKDFPTYYTYTPMSNIDYHHNPPFTFFYKETIDRRTTSQGFLVETNDMHGKMKRQAAYSESDGNTPLSYTLHTYKNTGVNGLNDKVDFVHNDQSGAVVSGNMGIDMELMTDVREFSVISNGTNVQAQVDFFTFVPWPVFGIFAYPLQSYTENKYRAVTTTKLINYHAIEDSVIVNDKGSTINTKTIAYDAETGSPVVTRTGNEFNDPVYNVSYPAWWAYSGMAPAYKNIGMLFSSVSFNNGQISSGMTTTEKGLLESGDELYILPNGGGSGSPGCVTSPSVNKLWVYDLNKNSTALTVPSASRNLIIMDSAGNLFSKSGVSFRIVRSGRRNNLGATITSATSMLNPIQTGQLLLNNSDSVVAASAVAFKEKWQTDADALFKTSITLVSCVSVESANCNGTLPSHLNPYVRGLVGNFKPYRSYTYYGSRMETDPTMKTRIRRNGFIQGFSNYWGFDGNSNMVPDNANAKWVWNSELTKVNGKGQELETRDALNRYTAAQYGFAKNLPVAMVQNARSGQSFDDGFEDYAYRETLNNSALDSCDNDRYISFNGLSNSTILNTEASAIKAHSGKYLLRVDAATQAIKALAVSQNAIDSFNFNLKQDTTGTLNDPGGNITGVLVNPSWLSTPHDPANDLAYLTARASFTGGGYNSGVIAAANSSSIISGMTHWAHNYSFSTFYYIQITTANTYTFSMSAGNNNGSPNTSDDVNMTVNISDLNSNPIGSQTATTANPTRTLPVSLCKGIYRVNISISDIFSAVTSGGGISPTNTFSMFISGSPAVSDYKSLSVTPTCIFTDPIKATDSMLNRSFAITPGRKMQFSAWVQEDCGNATGTPCFTTNYVNSRIDFQFPGSSTSSKSLYPSGTIIEGWQKIEGIVDIPADATTANMVLRNDGSRYAYFDDIRLHPFNADMKSYVYDPRTLRLSAELDENNYATFYNYDEEGQLVRVKKETIQGIKTIKEVRTAKQSSVKTVQ